MKLYRSIRKYKYHAIVEMVWADNKEQVYEYLLWKKSDHPKLEIKEIPVKPGCFSSLCVNTME